MANTPSADHFIEQIIKDDLKSDYQESELCFRFPPEPNGLLHIGHASAICLNFGLGEKYNAPVNLRFDDTNPIKEEDQYVQSIKKDVEWLGFKWTKECYASDYFQQLYDWAVYMIKKGNAYVDSQTSEEIAEQKGTPTESGTESPYRNRPVEENLDLFEAMKNGETPPRENVLRAKISMGAKNMLMRDPVMYRCLHESHHRTGSDWKIYPMYDWAHGQSDYIENITHSFCTLEFQPHRELYNWFLKKLPPSDQRKPKQREFARRNLSHTLVSKRKLAELVDKGYVDSWDDPRMPTIAGMRRRGFTPASIRNFADAIGIGKRENMIDVSRLEFCVRDDLNKVADRAMAVLDPLKVVITNYPEDKVEWIEAENNPDDENAGTHEVPFSRELYIEKADFREEANRKFFRLKLGKEVRLKSGYIIKANDVVKDGAGNITEVHCTYDEDSRSGSGTEAALRKVKGTLHWVSAAHALEAEVRLYDRLFVNEKPIKEAKDSFLESVNPDSLQKTTALIEPSLREAKIGKTYQFQRIGYFCVDPDSTKDKRVFNRAVTLRDNWKSK
jgi:glutaminyl-tRNA synthetase